MTPEAARRCRLAADQLDPGDPDGRALRHLAHRLDLAEPNGPLAAAATALLGTTGAEPRPTTPKVGATVTTRDAWLLPPGSVVRSTKENIVRDQDRFRFRTAEVGWHPPLAVGINYIVVKVGDTDPAPPGKAP